MLSKSTRRMNSKGLGHDRGEEIRSCHVPAGVYSSWVSAKTAAIAAFGEIGSMGVVGLYGGVRLVVLTALFLHSPAFAADLFVNNQDALCLAQAPCFSSIQEAIDQALPGDHIQIQPGVYPERLHIRKKNNFVGADDMNRIVIGRAEGAPVDSVVLTAKNSREGCRTAIEISNSGYITIRGLVITGFRGPAVRLRGGRKPNAAIQIERNRIFDNGRQGCSGGIVIEKGNPDTLVVNNLIYANGGSGIELSGKGGPHSLVQNTLHGNGKNGVTLSQNQTVVLANNAITGNGVAKQDRNRRNKRGGYGVLRKVSRDARDSRISMLNNLLCDNLAGEVAGPVFVGNHANNLTPTGTEEVGVLASPECVSPGGVYQNMEGVDGLSGTLDDDFALTRPGGQGLPSPAIDRGIDLGTLGLPIASDPPLVADFLAADVRPIQRDINRPLDFDIGALELPCACDSCASCEIKISDDGTSADSCTLTFDPATQCCNRLTGAISEKRLGEAFDSCPDTRSQRPDFDPEGNADGCSAVPDQLLLCPEVRLGCDEDANEENCPEGINLPCNRHDFCYQTCGATKDDCDLRFFDDILQVCDNMTAAQKVLCYDDCVATAAIYFDGVALGGGESYRNGQNRSCQCCRDVFFAPEPQP